MLPLGGDGDPKFEGQFGRDCQQIDNRLGQILNFGFRELRFGVAYPCGLPYTRCVKII